MSMDLFNDPTAQGLEYALNSLSLRQQVLANNIANAQTPGYVSQDVSFQSQLANILGGQETADPTATGTVVQSPDVSTRQDGNSVSMETEMAKVDETNVLYNTLTQLTADLHEHSQDRYHGLRERREWMVPAQLSAASAQLTTSTTYTDAALPGVTETPDMPRGFSFSEVLASEEQQGHTGASTEHQTTPAPVDQTLDTRASHAVPSPRGSAGAAATLPGRDPDGTPNHPVPWLHVMVPQHPAADPLDEVAAPVQGQEAATAGRTPVEGPAIAGLSTASFTKNSATRGTPIQNADRTGSPQPAARATTTREVKLTQEASKDKRSAGLSTTPDPKGIEQAATTSVAAVAVADVVATMPYPVAQRTDMPLNQPSLPEAARTGKAVASLLSTQQPGGPQAAIQPSVVAGAISTSASAPPGRGALAGEWGMRTARAIGAGIPSMTAQTATTTLSHMVWMPEQGSNARDSSGRNQQASTTIRPADTLTTGRTPGTPAVEVAPSGRSLALDDHATTVIQPDSQTIQGQDTLQPRAAAATAPVTHDTGAQPGEERLAATSTPVAPRNATTAQAAGHAQTVEQGQRPDTITVPRPPIATPMADAPEPASLAASDAGITTGDLPVPQAENPSTMLDAPLHSMHGDSGQPLQPRRVEDPTSTTPTQRTATSTPTIPVARVNTIPQGYQPRSGEDVPFMAQSAQATQDRPAGTSTPIPAQNSTTTQAAQTIEQGQRTDTITVPRTPSVTPQADAPEPASLAASGAGIAIGDPPVPQAENPNASLDQRLPTAHSTESQSGQVLHTVDRAMNAAGATIEAPTSPAATAAAAGHAPQPAQRQPVATTARPTPSATTGSTPAAATTGSDPEPVTGRQEAAAQGLVRPSTTPAPQPARAMNAAGGTIEAPAPPAATAAAAPIPTRQQAVRRNPRSDSPSPRHRTDLNHPRERSPQSSNAAQPQLSVSTANGPR